MASRGYSLALGENWGRSDYSEYEKSGFRPLTADELSGDTPYIGYVYSVATGSTFVDGSRLEAITQSEWASHAATDSSYLRHLPIGITAYKRNGSTTVYPYSAVTGTYYVKSGTTTRTHYTSAGYRRWYYTTSTSPTSVSQFTAYNGASPITLFYANGTDSSDAYAATSTSLYTRGAGTTQYNYTQIGNEEYDFRRYIAVSGYAKVTLTPYLYQESKATEMSDIFLTIDKSRAASYIILDSSEDDDVLLNMNSILN